MLKVPMNFIDYQTDYRLGLLSVELMISQVFLSKINNSDNL